MRPEPYDQERVERIDDTTGFKYCSAEELRSYLDASPDWTVADFGSGTGLFTSEIAPVVSRVYAIDIRTNMHREFQSKDPPSNTSMITADFSKLPFPDNSLDGGISIRTYHHGFGAILDEVHRVIRPGGRLVIVDWSGTGAGERETKTDETYETIASVQSDLLKNGFRVVTATERRETFVVIGSIRA